MKTAAHGGWWAGWRRTIRTAWICGSRASSCPRASPARRRGWRHHDVSQCRGESLNFDAPLRSSVIKARVRMPTEVQLESYFNLRAGTVLGGAVTTPDGTVYAAGTIVAANLLLEPGTTLAAGFMADQSITVAPFTPPKGTSLGIFDMQPALSSNLTLAPGSYLPSGSTLRFAGSSVPLRDLDATASRAASGPSRPCCPPVPSRGAFGWPAARIWRRPTRAPCCRPCSWPVAVRSGWRICIISRTCRRTAGRIAHFQRHPNREGRPGHPVRRRLPPDLVLRHLRQARSPAPCGITMATPSSMPWAGRLQPEAGQRSDQSLANGRESVLARVGLLRTAGDGRSVRRLVPGAGRQRLYRRAGQYACRHPGIASGPELSDKRGSGWMSGGYTGTWLWRQGGEDLGQRTAWWINFGTYVPTRSILPFASRASR